MFSRKFLPSIGFVLFLSGCESTRPSDLGEVYAGPATLSLREDISAKSKVTATAHHGDKLAIVQQRRRLYRVRTADNAEGWTDERNLMSTEQMRALLRFEELARGLPSQGVATSFEPLNIHTEPQRFAPSFAQIREGEKFDVIEHQLAPRTEAVRRVLVEPPPKALPSSRRKGKAASKKSSLAPEPPPAPKPPENWEQLSKERSAVVTGLDNEQDKEPANPPQIDDWTLVRTAKGESGWVLTGRIFMAIPDDVAQYAEGHRISSYFSLGKVHDQELGEDKDMWLWTTIRAGQREYDFDLFRVFTWNARKHRYETAYIQRDVEGYLPVLVSGTGDTREFSVCLGNDDGSRESRLFTFMDRHVKFNGRGECVKREPAKMDPGAPVKVETAAPAKASPTFRERLQGWEKSLFGK